MHEHEELLVLAVVFIMSLVATSPDVAALHTEASSKLKASKMEMLKPLFDVRKSSVELWIKTESGSDHRKSVKLMMPHWEQFMV